MEGWYFALSLINMGVTQWRVWKFWGFKNAASLLSSDNRLENCVLVSETGVISKESIPLAIGYCKAEKTKMAWADIQKLKMPMEGHDGLVLVISERSFMPLDPLNKLTPDEKKKLEPLKNIARAKHAEVLSRISDESRTNQHHELLKMMMYGLIFLCLVFAIVFLIKMK